MRDELVKLADEFDRAGKHDLADAVDQALHAEAAGRPKAPLKKLDDDVKKDLMKFLATVKKNMEDSIEALEELFRRMRYFDIDDMAKELGLDKVIKEMAKTNDCMDSATRTMYALTHGKKPSKTDMEQMAEDYGLRSDPRESPLDFFESRTPGDEPSFDERQLDMEEEELNEKLEEKLQEEAEFGEGQSAPEDTESDEEEDAQAPAYHDFEEDESVDEDELYSFWSGDDEDED